MVNPFASAADSSEPPASAARKSLFDATNRTAGARKAGLARRPSRVAGNIFAALSRAQAADTGASTIGNEGGGSGDGGDGGDADDGDEFSIEILDGAGEDADADADADMDAGVSGPDAEGAFDDADADVDGDSDGSGGGDGDGDGRGDGGSASGGVDVGSDTPVATARGFGADCDAAVAAAAGQILRAYAATAEAPSVESDTDTPAGAARDPAAVQSARAAESPARPHARSDRLEVAASAADVLAAAAAGGNQALPPSDGPVASGSLAPADLAAADVNSVAEPAASVAAAVDVFTGLWFRVPTLAWHDGAAVHAAYASEAGRLRTADSGAVSAESTSHSEAGALLLPLAPEAGPRLEQRSLEYRPTVAGGDASQAAPRGGSSLYAKRR
jgi:hypothetical protein